MSDEDFIDRWSRRKRAAARDQAGRDAEPARPEALTDSAPEPATDSAPAAPADPAPPISDEDLAALPRIEDLTPGSDIRAFLRPGVPATLKNAALRKMWMLTPAIRDHQDVAVDYAWDWNTPGGVPGAGGKIGAESLRKMVDALTGRETEKVAEPPAPDRTIDTTQDTPGTTATQAAEKPTQSPEKAQTRPTGRHGGAAPEEGAI